MFLTASAMVGPDDRIDADRQLALLHCPVENRAALRALWTLDATMGDALAVARDSMIGRIKLAWWRDALTALDIAPPPPEPVLEAVAATILPRDISGADLSALEHGWTELADPGGMTPSRLAAYARGRGACLFGLSARLLGGTVHPAVAAAGGGWALTDLARRSTRRAEANEAFARASPMLSDNGRLPRRLRPLAILAKRARRDAERGAGRIEPRGAPRRVAVILYAALTGR